MLEWQSPWWGRKFPSISFSHPYAATSKISDCRLTLESQFHPPPIPPKPWPTSWIFLRLKCLTICTIMSPWYYADSILTNSDLTLKLMILTWLQGSCQVASIQLIGSFRWQEHVIHWNTRNRPYSYLCLSVFIEWSLNFVCLFVLHTFAICWVH